MNLTAILSERASKVADLRSAIDAAEARGEITSEDQASIDRVSDEIRTLDSRIANRNALSAFEADEPEARGRETQARQADVTEIDEDAAYRDAFSAMLRGEADAEQIKALRRGYVAEEARDQAKGTAATGGYIAPAGFDNNLISRVEELSVVRTFCTNVLHTGNGNDLTFTAEDARGSAAWLDEGAAFVEDDEQFKQISIKAWKSGRLIKATLELVEDSYFPLETYLANAAAQSLAILEDAAFVNGDGTKKPSGFMTDASVGVTSTVAAASMTSGDEVIDLIYSLRPTYRRGAVFVVNDLAVKALRKLKDNNGQYLWQDALRAGEPTTLLGYPVNVEPNMPTPDVGATPVAFGNFARGYLIREVGGVRIARLGERYLADEGKIGYLAWRRVDGKLLDTEAVKLLKQKAS